MKKMPTIFKREFTPGPVLLPEHNPECEWVFEGIGDVTKKYDGTCTKIENGLYFKRREVKAKKPVPINFIEEGHDIVTGKRVGWVPVTEGEEDKYHREAFDSALPDGTYELVGPKIQGNPEVYLTHTLVAHATAVVYADVPLGFEELPIWLKDKDIEGIIFHHPDGRMAKIKKSDFGLKR